MLNTLWFILICVLYTGYFILEGFDFGVGALLFSLSRDQDPEKVDKKRRLMINTIGPHWDGNEVWLLTAGGATFAAFPEWYATMFSGFYLALLVLLLALIVRGVAFEFRSKEQNPRWRALWDWCIFIGSIVPPVLLGVAFANILRGVPINAAGQYVGGFFNLLNPYALLAGVSTLVVFIFYGALFLALKTSGEMAEKARSAAGRLWLPAVILLLALGIYTYVETDAISKLGIDPGLVPIASIAAVVVAGYLARRNRLGWAFGLTAAGIALALATLFMILYPNVMVSSLDPAYSLTILNAASSQYTLTVMTIVALIFTPLVLFYQAWTYRVFRKRLTPDSHLEY
jgi:cytochrome bd ubiquinol oxidase subunit II